MIGLAFTIAAGFLLGGAIVARANGYISLRTFYALVATSELTATIRTDRITGSINAAAFAITAWLWWHDGGGDDTKRRLRGWARKFRGVRRTAPAGGAA